MFDSVMEGDMWRLTDNDINSLDYKKSFIFGFTYIKSEKIKNVVKCFIWRNYIERNLSLRTLYGYANKFKKINLFAELNNISSLKSLDNNDISNIISFLKTSFIQTGKPLSYVYQKGCLVTLKVIIHWGQLYIPSEFPLKEIFSGNEYTGINRKPRIEFIPNDVVKQINIALKNEQNPYLKYGMKILQTTGMRIGDMLKLKNNGLKPHAISGWTLSWYDHKKRRFREPMLVPDACANAIQMLIDITSNLRQEADDSIKNYLFIHKITKGRRNIIGKVLNISDNCYRVWINGDKRNHMIGFNEKHMIKDSNGEIYHITAHQFRRTLATDMISKGEDILVIRDVLGHSDARTTRLYYADVKDKERAETFNSIGIIGNINIVDKTIIPDATELEWFKINKDRAARMCDGYCTKPIKNQEICERLLKRQKCYTCTRYITTTEYLKEHKAHLEELEQQLENNIYGNHYAEHIVPTIEILKEIIIRLEELENLNV